MAIRVMADRIDVAHVVPGARAAVSHCESYPVGGGGAVESLRELRRSLGLDRYRCTTLIEFPDYQMHQVEAPSVPDSELRQAVRWSIKDMIEYPVDDATVDVLKIPADAEHRARNVFVVSARNEHVKAVTALFEQAHVQLDAIDIPELAQRNLAVLCEVPNRAVALLAFHSGSCWLTITGAGELLVVRRIDISLDSLTSAEPDQRSSYLDRIALELQRSFDNFDRQFGFITLSRLVVSFAPPECGLKGTLQANLELPVEDFVLDDLLNLARVPAISGAAQQADRLLVLGAALRGTAMREAQGAAA